MHKFSFLFTVFLLTLMSCQKEQSVASLNADASLNALVLPPDFSFSTSVEHEVDVSVRGQNNEVLSGVKVLIYSEKPVNEGLLLSTGFTNDQGVYHDRIRIPAHFKKVYVLCNQMGFENAQWLPVSSIMKAQFGGAVTPHANGKTTGVKQRIPAGGNIYYMGTYNQNGLPDYLESPGDVIDQSLLDDMSAALPEQKPVPTYNPSYLNQANTLNIQVSALSEVWVTFVTEGAGYKNSLAYYAYDTDNPPATAADIDSIFVVIPNVSIGYGSNDLHSGDKVSLGIFPAGKTIEWVLLQNAYNINSQSVNVNAPKVFSNPAFNPGSGTQKQHTVRFEDATRQLYLNGFEDIHRTSPASDQDFNDCIFYVSANPFSAINNGSGPVLEPAADTDGDGVGDADDEFPNDPERAATVDFSGALGFEDLWPAKGDYDFNDMVVDYEIKHVLNASNKVVDVEAEWTIKAVGAGYDNGFGWQFDNVTSASVESVNGMAPASALVGLNGNGTEAAQTFATIIAWEKTSDVIEHAGGMFINTVPNDPVATPASKQISIHFSNPVDVTTLGLPPYNAFIFIDGDRSREVHMGDASPTDLASASWFGTEDDDSDLANGKTYKSVNNMPWAIHVAGSFAYPVEKTAINEAYLNFANWATSGGSLFANWYLDLPGYRNTPKVY
jgi:LruC domain-containing protein